MSHDDTIAAIILAAGQGKRMQSSLPKVLHKVDGIPMLARVLTAAEAAGVKRSVLILAQESSAFTNFLQSFPNVDAAVQPEARGTGDAVASAAPLFSEIDAPEWSQGKIHRGSPKPADWVLILAGDTPALEAKTLKAFLEHALSSNADFSVLGMNHPHPHGYGRLITNSNGDLQKIVEEKDANEEQRSVTLCNTGIMVAKSNVLFQLLADINTANAQKEYYLTDCIEIANSRQQRVHVFISDMWQSFSGVNTQEQLKDMEAYINSEKTFI